MEGDKPFHATVCNHTEDNRGRLILETIDGQPENFLVVEEGYELSYASALLSDDGRESLAVLKGEEF